YLKVQLPSYMLPQHVETLSELPRTLNGKLDRNALAKKETASANELGERHFNEPKTKTEHALLAIWQEVLHTRLIGTEDNFFDLGGHSLLIAKIIQHVEYRMEVRLQFRDLYNFTTIESLAAHIDQQKLGDSHFVVSIPVNDYREKHRLSLAQQRLWYLSKMEGNSTLQNLPSAFRLIGNLDVGAFNDAMNSLLDRQCLLRTRIIEENDRPYQVIEQEYRCEIEFYDLSMTAPEGREAALADLLQELQAHVFDILDFPLFRVTLIRLQPEEHALFFMPHHIIFDGWSFDVFIHELTTSYESHVKQVDPTLASLPIQYCDYAEWLRDWLDGDELKHQLEFWKHELRGRLPVLEMPVDFPRKDTELHQGDQVLFHLDEKLVHALSKLALQQGASLFMVMMSSYLILLHRYTNQDDLIVGAPMADRSRMGTENLIGFFVNALVLRFQVDKSQSFVELLAQVKETCLNAFNHQDAPFEKLVEVLNPDRDLSRAPLFQTSLTYQDVSEREVTMGDLLFQQIEVPSHDSPLDLNMWFKKRNGQMTGAVVYSVNLFERKTIEQFVSHFQKILSEVVANWHQSIGNIGILTPVENNQLISFGQGPQRHWEPMSLPGLLSQHVASRGSEVAVVSGVSSLTYDELEQTSNRLAHYLIRQGVVPNSLVGVCMSRSCDMLVALLAVWKAGAAYVPLDPDFPDDRLTYMADDAQLKLLLCDAGLQSRFSVIERSYSPDSWQPELAHQPATSPELPDDASAPAYVIYTSGSTGRPKGVVVPRGAVVNFLNGMAEQPGLSPEDRLLAVTTLSFDIAVLELYLPLVVGARVVISSREDAVDGRRLLSVIQQQGITTMQATPATWRLLLGSGWSGEPKLKALCGGEALPKDLAVQLLPHCASLWNMYGPTETTVWSTCAEVTHEDIVSPIPLPIGRAMANTQVYVLDSQSNPVPQGVAGELLIGGDGVTSGYLNRAELTAERFIDCPATLPPGKGKLYRTGDKVRFRHDGQLDYLGRMDQQVKVRGYRIELGEIETLLRTHEAVEDCAVSVKEERAGDARLIAYVVWRGSPLTMTDVRNYLKVQLPSYMLPQHVETLSELPRTLNGKLDRNALVKASSLRNQTEVNLPAETEMEKALARIWCSVIGIDSVAKTDHFFDVGGHSLLSMQVIHTVRDELGLQVTPRQLLLDSLTEIASQLDQQKTNPDADMATQSPGSAASSTTTIWQRWFGKNSKK
ncbi:MAG: amino acid adenylation domain-containing protein, partial [Reinekea sp.]|nr:amino acid adenylation domain-containing protein [Reinekea sp.]